jgi:hypothetical protein
MKKTDQRDYAIKTIEGLRRVSGISLFDFGSILAMPTRDLQTYLQDGVYRPLESRLRDASRDGFGAISYLLYSAFDKDKDLIALDFIQGVGIPGGRVPDKIEACLNLTGEKHIQKPKPIELMLYVKAIQDEPLLMPEDILTRELVFN